MICILEVAEDVPIALPIRSYCASSTAGASGRTPTTTRFDRRAPPSGIGCWRAGRTRICRRASIMSGCLTARWAIPRSATPISAPGGSSCRTCRASMRRSPTGKLAAMPGVARLHRQAEREPRDGSSDGAAVAGRGTFAPAPDRRARPDPCRGRVAGRGPRLSRRARHAAQSGCVLSEKFPARRRRP